MVRSALVAVFLVLVLASPATAAPPSVAGGDLLSRPGGSICQLSFNLSGRNILTGARCGPVGTRWYVGNVSVGVISAVLAGKDAAILHIDNPAVVQLAGVRFGGMLRPVTAAARAHVEQSVTYYSASTGSARTGRVTGVNQTVNFGGGTLTGLDRINLCQEPRDGGAPVISGTTALSLVSGGSICGVPGSIYAQPVVPVLVSTGLALYV